jgi:hypothetical protein
MGVYIPPCGDVQSSVNVCVCDIATVCATEVLAVPNANVTAFMASLRSICRRNGDNLNAILFTLVFEERAELIEIPRVASPAERLVAPLGVHTPSDILQVLNGNAFVFFLCFRYDLFTYAVIDNSGKSSLTSFQPFQQLMTAACAFGLNRSSYSVVSISYVFDFIRRNISTIRQRNDVCDTHIDTNKILCGFFFFIGDVYRLIQIELPSNENKVSFAFRILHELWTVASICYLLTTTNKRNGTDGFFGIIGKNAAIISDSSELSKMSLLLSIKFVCVGNLTDCTHDKLGGKTICFFNRVIDFFVQIEFMKKLKLEDTCLTIEQAKELKELGVDFSNAIMAFIDFYDENKHEYELVRNMSIGAYDIIPTLTNTEMLEMLPTETCFCKTDKGVEVWSRWLEYDGSEQCEPLLRDALFEMIKCLKTNKLI